MNDTTPAKSEPPGLVIRARFREDVEGIAELVNLPGFPYGTMRLPFHSLDEVRGWLERPADGDVNLIAILDGRIVGNGGLHRFQGRRSHAAEIGMGVHAGYIGRGIGTAILKALIDTAERWLGLRRLELTCYVDNAPALALYSPATAAMWMPMPWRAWAGRTPPHSPAIGRKAAWRPEHSSRVGRAAALRRRGHLPPVGRVPPPPTPKFWVPSANGSPDKDPSFKSPSCRPSSRR